MKEPIYKEFVVNTQKGTSTHFKIRTYLLEILEDGEKLSAIGDLIAKDGENETIISADYYHLASDFGLTIEDFIENGITDNNNSDANSIDNTHI
jgi:hypothetical protein